MTHRRVLSAMLAAAVVAMAGAALHARSAGLLAPAQLTTAAHPTGALATTLELSRPTPAEAVVAERTERAAEATSTDRRLASRDGRPLDWLAIVGLSAASVAALWTALARRRHRRVATVARWLAPARGPPLLLPS